MVNFGILGFGLHAVKRLMPGFGLAKSSRVTALSRRDISKARESARQYNIPLAFASAEDLCRSPEVDAVFVATPNACHLHDVLLAIEWGSRCCAKSRWQSMHMSAERWWGLREKP